MSRRTLNKRVTRVSRVEQWAEARCLYEGGLSLEGVAEKLGIPYSERALSRVGREPASALQGWAEGPQTSGREGQADMQKAGEGSVWSKSWHWSRPKTLSCWREGVWLPTVRVPRWRYRAWSQKSSHD